MDLTRLSHVGGWDGKAEREGTRHSSQEAKGSQKEGNQNICIREELLGERYACHTLYLVRREGCWKNIVVRFDLIC